MLVRSLRSVRFVLGQKHELRYFWRLLKNGAGLGNWTLTPTE